MRILVVGAGGREHAIVRALGRSPRAPEVLCTPGNAGIAADARCLEAGAEDVPAIVEAARDEGVDLVVVGPEAPLVAGLVDELEAAGIPAFGPSGEAAEHRGLEAVRQGADGRGGRPDRRPPGGPAPCARPSRPSRSAKFPCVMKADGLAAGKGVIICETEADAREATEVFFGEERFGETDVVLEEFLEGEELSLLAVCDGENVVPLAPAQDYKRIGDGDEGPNTGGMGSYSPVPGFEPGRGRRSSSRASTARSSTRWPRAAPRTAASSTRA